MDTIRVTYKDQHGATHTCDVPWRDGTAELTFADNVEVTGVVTVADDAAEGPRDADGKINRKLWPEFYATSEVAAVREKHCVGFDSDDPLTALDKAFAVRTEAARHDFRAGVRSGIAEASAHDAKFPALPDPSGLPPSAPQTPIEKSLNPCDTDSRCLMCGVIVNADRATGAPAFHRPTDCVHALKRFIGKVSDDETRRLRAFVAAVAALPCFHWTRDRDADRCQHDDCLSCIAKRLMASEERTASPR